MKATHYCNKSKNKNYVSRLLLASMVSLIVPNFSYAYVAMPKIDIGNVGAKVIENAQIILESEEMKVIYKNIAEMKGKIAEFKIDSQNEIATRKIFSEQQARAEESKIKALQASQPGINACSIIASVAVAAETGCVAASYSKRSTSKSAAISSVPEGGQIKNPALEAFRDRIAKSIEEANKLELNEPSSSISNDKVEEALTSSPLSPFYLLSSDKNTFSLSKENREKMEDYILLIAPPFVETVKEREITDLNEKTAIIASIKRAMMSVPNSVLNDVLSNRVAVDDNSESKLFAWYNMANSYFSFEDIAALNKNKDFVDAGSMYKGGRIDSIATRLSLAQLASPDVTIRAVAAMKATKINSMLESYKVDLNREIIMATMLAKKVNML